MKYNVILLLIVCCAIYVEGDWKFWKKATTTTTTTTVIPDITTATGSTNKQNLPVNTSLNRDKPKTPNPGTEVGQDFPGLKPIRPEIGGNNGQTYREWAIGIAGAGEPVKQPVQNPNSQQPSNLNIPNHQRPTQANNPLIAQKPSIQQASTTSKPATNLNTGPKSNLHDVIIQPTKAPETPKATTSQSAGFPSIQNKPSGNQSSQNVPHPLPTRGPSYADIAGRPNPSQSLRPLQIEQTTAKSLSGNTQVISTNTGKKVYSSNPTYSKGNTVTDEDLEKLSEALFIKDTNNVNRLITLNLQKKTSSGSNVDEAPQPLLQVNNEALQTPTIQRVLTIFDNYNLDTKTYEHINPQQREEESLLIDTFLSTNVMSAAMRFLADKGFVKKDYYEYKDLLRILWFNLFSRGEGKIGSSGFEHVFLAEIKGSELIGLHNWIYLHAEETKNRANYLGYLKKVDLGDKAYIVKVHLKFNDIIKPSTTIFVGTSPELEMALYTVCFMTRPEQPCPLSLGHTKFNIITHKFRYRGKDLIGTAYPEI